MAEYDQNQEGATVAVVDDSPVDLILLKKILSSKGYQVKTYTKGDAFLSRAWSVPPDLVLLDVRMPGIDGYEICRSLKADARTREVPVIFISAVDELINKVKGFSVGGVDYITKPFETEDVLARIKTHLYLHFMRRRLESQNLMLQQEIAERKKIEAELKRHREQLEDEVRSRASNLREAVEMINRSPAVVILWQNKEGWPVEFVSDNVGAIFGYSSKDFMSGSVLYEQVVHPDDLERIKREFAGYSGEPGRTEFTHQPYRIVSKDGTVKWIEDHAYLRRDADGNVVYYQGIVIDITERKWAEDNLRKSQKLMETLFSQSLAGFFFMMLDTPICWHGRPEKEKILDDVFHRLRITRANDAVLAQYGATREQFLGLAPKDLFAHSVGCGKDMWRNLLEMGKIQVEMEQRKFDGTFMFVEAEYVCFYDEQRYITGCFGIQRDISDRKLAESEREMLIRELEAKNAELERFAYTVSHELKAPLVTIKSFSSMLEKDLAKRDSQKLTQDLEFIRSGADQMQHLLNDLLELSRIGLVINPMEPVDLKALVNEVRELVSAPIHSRGVRFTVAENLPTVFGDRHRLLEVFQNLVENAVKFMGDQTEPCIEIGWQKKETEIVCFVKDNGVGIDPRYQQKVFGLFERLDPSVEGTGVGLAIVKRIIETHGGRIWVRSEGSLQGCTFYFTLPVRKGLS